MEQGLTSHSKENRSFQTRSFQPTSWLGTKKTKRSKTNTHKPEWSKLTQKHTKIQTKPVKMHTKTTLTQNKHKFKNCLYLCAGLGHRRTWVQNAAAMLSGNSLRQTVHTHCASVHHAAKLVAALLRVARVTAGLAGSYKLAFLLDAIWLKW